MRVAGIDPDTKSITVFVIEDPPPPVETKDWLWFRLTASGARAEDRFLNLVQQVRGVVEVPGHSEEPLAFLSTCDYVYLERPFVGPNRKAAIDMGMVVGAIRAELDRAGVRHSLVDAAVWKTNMLGTSRVSKEEIKAWAMTRFHLSGTFIQDVYDAATIAAYGLSRLTGGNGKRPL